MSTDEKMLLLIVDDVAQNIEVLGNILIGAGYEIVTAENGSEALQILDENIRPDLILLDVMMPGMNGFEVCEKVKANEKLRQIPIIFLTAKTETEDIVTGFNVGAVDYLTKPFNSTELLARVKTHLEIKKLQDQLRESNRSKDKFFSIIAHDLKNPLSALYGLSQLFIDEIDKIDKKEIYDLSLEMNRSLKNIFNLLENLLNWSRMQTGSMEWKPVNLSILAVIEKTFELLQQAARQKDIQLLVTSEEPLGVFADENMLETIFRNLLSNAIKFTPRGGKIEVAYRATAKMVEVRIIDKGVGMNEEQKNSVFRIDTRHSSYGTENESGTGLGLVLCKELVEKNGGEISVESEVGKGSTFVFTLKKSQ